MSYGMTVAIWLAFYVGFVFIFKERFFENGWLREEDRPLYMTGNAYFWLLLCAMVPIWRFVVALGFIGAATMVNDDEDD